MMIHTLQYPQSVTIPDKRRRKNNCYMFPFLKNMMTFSIYPLLLFQYIYGFHQKHSFKLYPCN
eukprot:UN04218